jgi:hypothetical protein
MGGDTSVPHDESEKYEGLPKTRVDLLKVVSQRTVSPDRKYIFCSTASSKWENQPSHRLSQSTLTTTNNLVRAFFSSPVQKIA